MNRSVVVLGAGIVGVSTALELQARGADVTLVDRKAPGRETSYGNAGVIARSSIVPINNPALWSALPRLLRNNTAGLRYDPWFLLKNPKWVAGFLARARGAPYRRTATALDALIRLSGDAHRRLLTEAGARHRLNDQGWIHLHRSTRGFDASRFVRETYEAFGIDTEVLDAAGIARLEPGLKRVFSHGLWIKDACSVDDPGAVVQAYATLFRQRGGRIETCHVSGLEQLDGQWGVTGASDRRISADNAVVCLGPWSRGFLEKLGLSVPMAFERGYHMHYSGAASTNDAPPLSRPVYDTGGGYVLAPMQQGLRLSTGVEIADIDAPLNPAQIDLAERAAREAIALGERVEKRPWMGRRPTLPDSRPAIGAAPRRSGLYLNFGHQHIGFNAGPGSAVLLADLIERNKPAIDAAPFAPARFIH